MSIKWSAALLAVLVSSTGFAAFPQSPTRDQKDTKKTIETSAGKRNRRLGNRHVVPDPVGGRIADEQNALESVARQMMQNGQWKEAQKKLKETIRLAPLSVSPAVYFELGECQYRQGESQEALLSMKKAFFGTGIGLETEPARLIRFLEIADACGEQGLCEEIWALSFRALEFMGGDVSRELNKKATINQKKALVLVAASEEAIALHDLSRMKQLNEAALAFDPNCALAHLNLGKMSITPEALRHLEKAVEFGSPDIKKYAQDKVVTLRYFVELEMMNKLM